MATPEQTHYTTIEKALYQLIAAQGSINEEQLEQLFKRLTEDTDRFNNQETIAQLQTRTLEDSIELINDRIKFIHEKITKFSHQTERVKLYFLIRSAGAITSDSDNTNGSGSSQGLNTLPFTAREIGAINRLIDTIITDNDPVEKFLVTGKQAIHIVGAETSYTGTQSKKFLQRLVTEGFLVQTPRDRFMISSRSLVELQEHLIEQHSLRKEGGLINKCIACNEIQTSGTRCPNLDCWVRLHKLCREPYQRAHGQMCPDCGTEWTSENTVFVGEMALSQNN
ncbi:hypothetical protein WICPIJ_009813 [Wickerhamomyces pijperi]|uniref:Non-structural maintenance of chromosomes element 1 homolog n=1 Tax=Wickerhamomyces pijperi TaxID=599730 RepID=A0A9P8PKW8_WICPI|nr:hypothetical protein WICPIJ_009813 [Wickerhamomyces pijperi]